MGSLSRLSPSAWVFNVPPFLGLAPTHPQKACQKVYTIMLIYSVKTPLLQAFAPRKIK